MAAASAVSVHKGAGDLLRFFILVPVVAMEADSMAKPVHGSVARWGNRQASTPMPARRRNRMA
jgi:hypothetical protein